MSDARARRLAALATAGLAAIGSGLGCSATECTPGCSEDGRVALTCSDGKARSVECARDRGQLCEAGACVDPWRFGAPAYARCDGDPLSTPEGLATKAARYDAIATRLHLHPRLPWVLNVRLEPGASEETATWADVERWESGENDGLWSALYLASQAFRYAATRSGEALATIKTLLAGEVLRMRITGVPGVFTRQLIPPGVPGIACPGDDASYTTDAEKDDNRWVQIRADGCVWVVDRASGAWTRSEHCGLPDLAGWCWLDNVSKDEYAGHLYALGALVKLVDDPEVQATLRDLLGQIGDALVRGKLKLTDWDGRTPEHGRFSPFIFDDFPGFNAAMAMGYLLIAAEATGREDLRAFYEDCLIQTKGRRDCLETGLERPETFLELLPSSGMYVGAEGCQSNFNNVSMHLLTLHNLIWFARSPVRETVQRSLDQDVMRPPGQARAILDQNNAFFDFVWAAQKRLGPGSDGPAFAAVENGVCMLRQFRASQAAAEVTLSAAHQPHCKDRFGDDLSDRPRTAAERCTSTFVWWGNPFDLDTCGADPRRIAQPSGYLLPYWMGRYYGFIPADL